MKKILLINNGYPSLTHPNYVTYIQTIRECLETAGFQVDLLVLDSNFNSFIGKYIQFLKYYRKLILFRCYPNYDFAYINNYPHSFLPLIFHFKRMKKVVVHWHGDDIIPRSFRSRILNSLSYKFIGGNFIHVAPSNYFARQVAKKLKLDIGKIFVSPSGGIDTHNFIAGSKKKFDSNYIHLGFASGLIQSKGADLLVKILENSNDIENSIARKIKIHFIEYGAEKQNYVNLLSTFSNTEKHPVYSIDRMSQFYNKIDILLLPSLGDSLGLVALEAMACGVPVIATDDFAFRETVIENLTGERFEMNNFQSFHEALKKCVSRLASYAPRNFVLKNYSKEAVIEGYRKLLGLATDKNGM